MAINKGRKAAAHNSVIAKERGREKTESSRSEQEWRAVFDSLSDAIMILDKDCRITMANKAAAEFLELPVESITGEHCCNLLHHTDGPVANCPLVKMLGSQKSEENELYLDGKGIWARVTACSPFSPEGEETKVVHILRDISSQRMIDDALRKRVKELNCLYDLSRLVETKGNAVEAIFEETLKLLSKACQYPEIAAAKLVCEGREFTSPKWSVTPWVLSQDISISGKTLGSLQVAYLEERPNYNGEPFLEEEKSLLRAIAERLAHVIDRYRTDAALRESNAVLKTQQETSLDGILVVNEKGDIISYNQRFVEIWDIPQDIIESRSHGRVLELVSDRVVSSDASNAVVRHLYEHSDEKSHDEISLKDGRTLHRYSAPMLGEDGLHYGRVWYFRDITEYKQAQSEVIQANENLTATVSKLQERNNYNNILSEMREMLQACSSVAEVSSIIRGSMAKLFPHAAGALFMMSASRSDLESAIRWEDFPSDVDENMFAPDACWALRRGRVHFVENVNVGPVCPHLKHPPKTAYVCLPLVAKGDVLGMLHLRGKQSVDIELQRKTASDLRELAATITEYLSLSIANIRLGEKLAAQSIRDPLTGLFNRRYMEESLRREIFRAERKKTPIGIVMTDIDFFKQFNDKYGHAAGDALLAKLGEFLKAKIRGADVACRYGGEEFILFLPESSAENTYKRMDRIREEVRLLDVRFRGEPLDAITLSFGIATYPDQGIDAEILLSAADAALYRAKQEGRNRIVVA